MSMNDKITTRAEAGGLLSEYAELDREIDRITRDTEGECAKLQQVASQATATNRERCAAITKRLAAWFKKEEPKLGGARSLKLPAGTLGLRDGTPRIECLDGWDDAESLRVMQRNEKWEPYIRHGKDTIDKPSLLKATELHGAPLARVGMKVGKKKDEFFIDPDVADTRERVA